MGRWKEAEDRASTELRIAEAWGSGNTSTTQPGRNSEKFRAMVDSQGLDNFRKNHQLLQPGKSESHRQSQPEKSESHRQSQSTLRPHQMACQRITARHKSKPSSRS